MSGYSNFYVDKSTQTFADALVAFGLARIVDELLSNQSGDRAILTLHDKGAYFHLVCDPPLEENTIIQLAGQRSFIQALETQKNRDNLPAGIPAVSYEAERDIRNQYFEARDKAVQGQEITATPPHRHWDIFRAINPSALPGYTSLVSDWWNIREAQADVLFLIFELFSTTPNPISDAMDAWKALDKKYGWNISADATGQQLYNPDQGKGQNRTKASGLSIGNQKNFWLLEWLKAIGFYESAMTRQVRGSKDRKTFVIAPRELTFDDSRAVMGTFLDSMQFSETATKFDILAALRYTQALITHFRDRSGGAAWLRQRRSIKKRVVAGFQTAFYKDLGNAAATMNLAFIALPGWITIEQDDDIGVYLDLLDELVQLTRQFDESHSDAFNLLQHLRNFVSGDDLAAFFRFTDAYPAYLMGMRERNKYVYQIHTTFIERLIQSMPTERALTPILQSEGFQNIAYAIRQSTVTAQYRKKQGDRKYDVRYGLGQELTRKSRYPDDFIAELSDFLHKYNAENAQVMENRGGPYRRSIKTSDIDEIIALIDDYGSEPVAKLLIAYGYARIPREDDEFSED